MNLEQYNKIQELRVIEDLTRECVKTITKTKPFLKQDIKEVD